MLKSDQFQTFVRDNRAMLRLAGFDESDLRTLDAVAKDLQQANRSLTAVRIPGQSNTAQDTLAAAKGDGPKTILAKLLVASLASGGGTILVGGGPVLDRLPASVRSSSERCARTAFVKSTSW
ncbi:MAG: hypothetical protein IPK28_15055 [Devosia sp.]|nr:hypothetical protein [Devosia sp.]